MDAMIGWLLAMFTTGGFVLGWLFSSLYHAVQEQKTQDDLRASKRQEIQVTRQVYGIINPINERIAIRLDMIEKKLNKDSQRDPASSVEYSEGHRNGD